jgi:hypothetical protein
MRYFPTATVITLTLIHVLSYLHCSSDVISDFRLVSRNLQATKFLKETNGIASGLGGLVVSILVSGTFGVLVVSMLASGTFGGLVVSTLASGTQVRGFKHGRSRRIFRAKKSSACLPSEGK